MTRRATDAEREAVQRMLSDARVAGMLTEEEWEDRVKQTAKVQDISELQALYSPITGLGIPILALQVTKEWYAEAGEVVEACESIARDRTNYIIWGSIPLLALIALLVTYNEYSYTPRWPMLILLAYTALAYCAMGVSHLRTERVARKVKLLLSEAGIQ